MLSLLVAAVVAGLAFANGANDVSKGVAPLIGSGVTGYRAALAWGTAWTAAGAALGAVFAGAMLATFGSGLLAPGVAPSFTAAAAAVVGAALWVALATRTGLPVSTTHALVGAIIGSAVLGGGLGAVRWTALGGKVVLPLLSSPLVALLFTMGAARALGGARGEAPANDCLCAGPAPDVALAARPGEAVVLARQGGLRLATGPSQACSVAPSWTLRISLGPLQWLTSAGVSLARGMNDAPKIVALGLAAAALLPGGRGQAWSLFAAVAAGMVAGSLWAGRRVTEVLAERVTSLDAPAGLAASGVAAVLVSAGAVYGLPMSTTHVALGGIAGAGAVRGFVNGGTLRQIALAWVVTLPASALLAALAELGLRALGV